MAMDANRPVGGPSTEPLMRRWDMTSAIRETGWGGGGAVQEDQLRAFGMVEREVVAAIGADLEAAGKAEAAPAAPKGDEVSRTTMELASTVINAAKKSEEPAPPPPPPAPPPQVKKKKKKGCLKKVVGAVKSFFRDPIGTIKKAVKAVVKFVVDTVKKAAACLKKILVATFNLIKNAILVIYSYYKMIAKAVFNVIKTGLEVAGKLLTGDFKGAWQAAKDGVKNTWEALKADAKELWKNTVEMIKNIGEIILESIKLAELIVPGFKQVTDFLKSKYGMYVMIALGVLAMIPPLTAVLGPIMLAVALYQGAMMMGQGFKNGDWKMAAMGIVTVASSLVGLGALGRMSAQTAQTVQRGLNIASGSVKGAVAVSNGDWKGAILAGASVAGAASGSAMAQTVTNVATKGFAVEEAVRKKDWVAAAAGIVAVGAATVALASVAVAPGEDGKPTWLGEKLQGAKAWVGKQWESFKQTAVGQAIMKGVDWVKARVDDVDQYLFGSKVDGVRQQDGLVHKITGSYKKYVQDPVAKAFQPVKDALS
ncbi:MAG: hypothetical protein FJZ00_05460, partial [Candidatus Sericytochromatia bacterium]|nr:hypothetical protein [Candidatus Tanganyikabacteria bacterium]